MMKEKKSSPQDEGEIIIVVIVRQHQIVPLKWQSDQNDLRNLVELNLAKSE